MLQRRRPDPTLEEHRDAPHHTKRHDEDAPTNFTGDVYLDPIFGGDDTSRLVVGLVCFTPGARTNWHSHANGQLLVCTDGAGLVVSRDGTVLRLRAGESAWTPPGEEHWHGGQANQMMCHYAILTETDAGDATRWLELVTDGALRRRHERPLRPPGPPRGTNSRCLGKTRGCDNGPPAVRQDLAAVAPRDR